MSPKARHGWDRLQFSDREKPVGEGGATIPGVQLSALDAAATRYYLSPGGARGAWLASQGHEVLTVDISEVGVARARALAAELGVRVDTLVADLKVWTPPAGAFHAVVLTYLHMPPAIRTAVHRKVAAALRPGGLLLLEAFHPRQLGRGSGGPKEIELLYTLDDLRSDFAGALDEESGEELDVLLNCLRRSVWSDGPGR